MTIPLRGIFRLDLTVWVLKRRPRNRTDFWDGERYIRVLNVEGQPVKVEVMQKRVDRLSVRFKYRKELPSLRAEVKRALTKMLGLEIDLEPFYRQAAENTNFFPIVKRFQGAKPTRYPTLFEAVSNAVCCQQISLESGLTALNKLLETYGKPFHDNEMTFYAFPEAKRIKRCTVEELMGLGLSRHKSEALIRMATWLTKDHEATTQLEQLSDEEALAFLSQLKGLGRWSAEYILLRGLGRLEVLPGDDVGIRKMVRQLWKLRSPPDYSKIKAIEKKWAPFGGLIYFHLLLHKIYAAASAEDGSEQH